MAALSFTEVAFPLVGGLGMFLFGMKQMSDGLRRAAGGRLEHILGVLCKTLPAAILLGMVVTCVVQSSSATTVMVVGFVNARMLALRQAIGAVMGANIGTTITAWLVAAGLSVKALKISIYALPMIGLGFLLNTAMKRRGWRLFGQVVLGLGLLLFGLGVMKDAFGPLAKSEHTKELFARFSTNPLLGVLVGAVVTMLLQSSSATIAIVQVLAAQGIVSLDAAIPLVLGDNIGTTITAQLAAIGTNRNARRAARAHLLFNVFGVLWVLPLVYLGVFGRIVDSIVPGIPQGAAVPHIAAAHTIFNVANTLVFLPMIGLLERMAIRLAGGADKDDDGEARYLEPHLLDTPGAAMEGARREIVRMMEIAREVVTQAKTGLVQSDHGALRGFAQKEETVDRLQRLITDYLIEISQRNLEPSDSQALPVLIHTVNDVERIGDHGVNIAELAERRIDGRHAFSDGAKGEMDAVWSELDSMMDTTIEALRANDKKLAQAALVHEAEINHLQDTYRLSHAQRLTDRTCSVPAGLIFLDTVANYEKIADHLTNINQAILGSFQWGEPVKVATHLS